MVKIKSPLLNNVFLTLFVTSISLASFGQWNTTDWKFSDPKPFGFTTLDAQFINNNIGVAVGDQGGIARTTDGGTTWTYGAFTFTTPTGFTTKRTFQDVHFVSPTHIYAVGDGGLMVKSTDAGASWTYVMNPFFGRQRNINAVWFTSNDVGYIGGDWLNADSIPRLYRTLNGGATWDSMMVNITGKSRVGYVNNPNIAPIIRDVTAKAKVINKIIFTSPTVGYISGGSASGSGNFFPTMPSVNSPTAATNPCGLTGNTTVSSSGDGSLFWKFNNGQLIDYSFSKERLGYTGINTNTVVCNTTFGQISPQTQTYRAMHIINDTAVVVMSFNNNCVVRVNTGRNDSTTNIATGLKEHGVFQILSFPFPPTAGPNAGPPIPNPNTLLASQPYHIVKGPDNKLYSPIGSSVFAPENKTLVSSDTGKTWNVIAQIPLGRNFSGFRHYNINFLPNGKAIVNGQNGVIADSFPGPWNSTYIYHNPGISGDEIDFADCNNGIVAGGSTISVTENGARTWIPRNRADFANSNTSITGVSYPFINKAYFSANNGVVYKSIDKAVTLDPAYANALFQMNDVTAIGQDTVYALGYSAFSVAATSRKSTIFRSINNGTTWTPFDIVVTTTAPAFTAPTLRKMSWGSRNVGYAAGTRNGIYKTTNAGATWTSINPFPSLNFAPAGFPNSSVTYTDIFALDENTVFVCGNMFTTANNRRIYKSTDGGTNWVDISGNLPTLVEIGNLNGILFHDANNGYVVLPGGAMIRTTNGGTSWTVHLAPSGVLTEHLAFAPKIAPPGTSMANRRLFVSGFGAGHILEFGNPVQTQVSYTESTTQASCTAPNGGSITVTATGGVAPYMYSINGGASQTSNIFSGLAQGTYTVRAMSQACDTATKTITIGFNNNLVVNKSNDTTVCAGAPVPLLASGNAASYTWTPTTGLSATNIANPTAIITAPIAYTVTGTLNGCSLARTINVNIQANPFVTAGPDFTIVDGDNVTLLGNGLANVVNIAWTPTSSILSGATTFTPIVKPSTTTTYTITVRDNNSCTSTDQSVVTVIPYCVKVMDAFTPNGDGINDRWVVTTSAACTKQVIVNVYNRYGALMYNNENYSNNWDGTYKGKPIADGTYYYKITYRLINGNTVMHQGDVTILR